MQTNYKKQKDYKWGEFEYWLEFSWHCGIIVSFYQRVVFYMRAVALKLFDRSQIMDVKYIAVAQMCIYFKANISQCCH